MKLTFVGTGYVGLVSGTCFADLGNDVICVDNNPEKLATLNRNECPFFEPGLSEKIQFNRDAGRLTFSNDLATASLNAELIFIAVGTPSDANGAADLSAVFAVANAVINTLKTHNDGQKRVIITKSTVPVGTGHKISTLIQEAGLNPSQLAVVSNPEFLREGSAIYDFFHPDRIVLGSDDEEALDIVSKVYEPLYLNEAPIVRTSLTSSELSKYASNAFLATKISFINEIANLCEKVDANVQDVAKIMGMDKRIGRFFLHAGPGYGGSCFPKDTKALVSIGQDVDVDMSITQAADSSNDRQKVHHLKTLHQYFDGQLAGKTVAVLGIAFKPNTDDIREAPALEIITQLRKANCKIRTFDPEAMDNAKAYFNNDPEIQFCANSYETCTGADAILLVTEWHAFRELDLARLHELVTHNLFIDLRNVYTPEKLSAAGFDSVFTGRAISSSGQVPSSKV